MSSFTISSDHPALPGHFPGQPVVPGVVLLDAVREALASEMPGQRIAGILYVKFMQPLLPDQVCTLNIDHGQSRCRFRIESGDRLVAQGELALEAAE